MVYLSWGSLDYVRALSATRGNMFQLRILPFLAVTLIPIERQIPETMQQVKIA
jgi:hypothetical protein